jgi:energy-coupling factor transporter ATP-binding protein EcfA2
MTAIPEARATAVDPRLIVEGLSVRYYGRDRDALEDIDLRVAAGDLVGVAGPNGAGKSTLVLAVTGLIPRIIRARLSGTIRLGGSPSSLDGDGTSTERVGVVFSNPANQLSGTKVSVREELAFGLENVGVPRAEMDPRIDATLDRLGIAHLAARYPYALSGGEQQRVAIASIVVMDPHVLVLDEPTGQLDPAGTEAVAGMLLTLARAGTGVVIAEHDPAVLRHTTRCLVLSDGRSVAEDAPARALGSDVLRPIGLEPPPEIAIAEALGLPPDRRFDVERIVEAIAAVQADGSRPGRPHERAPAPAPSPSPADAAPWDPVRRHEPTPIELLALVHRYPSGVDALSGVDLLLSPWTSVAIVGENGSGKTTLVKHFDGLLRPTAGRVRVGGRDIARVPVHELAATIGFVFQDPDDQLFNRSVEREVRFGPDNLHLPDETVTRLVTQALIATGLEEERATNPYDLDVSRRKLVALASVLAMDPAVLVLDEPTTGQDARGIARVASVVRTWTGLRRTVVAITHDMAFAAAMDRVVVMRQGSVVLDGPPREVFGPANRAVLASTGLRLPSVADIADRAGMAAPLPLTVAALLARLDVLDRVGRRGPSDPLNPLPGRPP